MNPSAALAEAPTLQPTDNDLEIGGQSLYRPNKFNLNLFSDSRVGDKSQKIAPYEDEIVNSIYNERVVIIGAPTGVGKSTQIIQWLISAREINHSTGELVPIFPAGANCTQPRRLAATEVRGFAADQYGQSINEDGRQLIGHQTGFDSDISPLNLARYCTERIFSNQVSLSSDNPNCQRSCTIIDEAHEEGKESELAIALAKEKLRCDPFFTLVLQSATLDDTHLAEQFRAFCGGQPAKIINVPIETPYNIEKLLESDFFESVARRALDGVLGVLPGKGEIDLASDIIYTRLADQGLSEVPIFPLHSDQTHEEQQRALIYRGIPRIILGTKIVTTSLTPIGINAVVNSGVGRHTVMNSYGDETLDYHRLSAAEITQGAGRVGRVADGVAVEAPLGGYLGELSKTEPPEREVPAILRDQLDDLMLATTAKDLDFEKLEFSHQPSYAHRKIGHLRLQRLGASTTDGKKTETGLAMTRLPLDPNFARMVVEAERSDNPRLKLQMLAAASIAQSKGIVVRDYPKKMVAPWRKLSPSEDKSNLLQELDVFCALLKMPGLTNARLSKLGILPRRLKQSQMLYHKVCEDNGWEEKILSSPDSNEREQLYSAIITGSVSGVFVKPNRNSKTFKRGKKSSWTTDKQGAVPDSAMMVVGQPVGIQIAGKKDVKTRWIINGATAVTVEQLKTSMPERITEQPTGKYRLTGAELSEWTKILVDDQHTGVSGLHVVTEQTPSLRQFFASRAESSAALKPLVEQIRSLSDKLPKDKVLPDGVLQRFIAKHIPDDVINLKSLHDYLHAAARSGDISLETVLPEIDGNEINIQKPDQVTAGKRIYNVTYNQGIAQVDGCDPADHKTIVDIFEGLEGDVDIIDARISKTSRKHRGKKDRH